MTKPTKAWSRSAILMLTWSDVRFSCSVDVQSQDHMSDENGLPRKKTYEWHCERLGYVTASHCSLHVAFSNSYSLDAGYPKSDRG